MARAVPRSSYLQQMAPRARAQPSGGLPLLAPPRLMFRPGYLPIEPLEQEPMAAPVAATPHPPMPRTAVAPAVTREYGPAPARLPAAPARLPPEGAPSRPVTRSSEDVLGRGPSPAPLAETGRPGPIVPTLQPPSTVAAPPQASIPVSHAPRRSDPPSVNTTRGEGAQRSLTPPAKQYSPERPIPLPAGQEVAGDRGPTDRGGHTEHVAPPPPVRATRPSDLLPVSGPPRVIMPPAAPAPTRPSPPRAQPAPGLHIGTLEVHVTTPPAPIAAASPRALPRPSVRPPATAGTSIARGFGIFGLGQS